MTIPEINSRSPRAAISSNSENPDCRPPAPHFSAITESDTLPPQKGFVFSEVTVDCGSAPVPVDPTPDRTLAATVICFRLVVPAGVEICHTRMEYQVAGAAPPATASGFPLLSR